MLTILFGAGATFHDGLGFTKMMRLCLQNSVTGRPNGFKCNISLKYYFLSLLSLLTIAYTRNFRLLNSSRTRLN
jgi:hypothetical protein